jgi:hypothetical protein
MCLSRNKENLVLNCLRWRIDSKEKSATVVSVNLVIICPGGDQEVWFYASSPGHNTGDSTAKVSQVLMPVESSNFQMMTKDSVFARCSCKSGSNGFYEYRCGVTVSSKGFRKSNRGQLQLCNIRQHAWSGLRLPCNVNDGWKLEFWVVEGGKQEIVDWSCQDALFNRTVSTGEGQSRRGFGCPFFRFLLRSVSTK